MKWNVCWELLHMGSFVKIPRGNEQTRTAWKFHQKTPNHMKIVFFQVYAHISYQREFHLDLWNVFPLSSGTILQSKNKDLLTLPSEGAFLQVDYSALCSVCLQFNKEAEMWVQVLDFPCYCMENQRQLPVISMVMEKGLDKSRHVAFSFLNSQLCQPPYYLCLFPQGANTFLFRPDYQNQNFFSPVIYWGPPLFRHASFIFCPVHN